jgi:hypothetical protein
MRTECREGSTSKAELAYDAGYGATKEDYRAIGCAAMQLFRQLFRLA